MTELTKKLADIQTKLKAKKSSYNMSAPNKLR